jgi:hypothetical protein
MATKANDALAKFNDVYQRSMLTGVPTSEFNAALVAAGFKPGETYEASQALEAAGYQTGRPTNENILKYGPDIAKSGVGNLSYAPGSNIKKDLTDRGLDPKLAKLDEFSNNYYEQAQLADQNSPFNRKIDALNNQYSTLNTNYSALNSQLTALQKAYDALAKKNTGTGTTTTGGTTGSIGPVDTGGTNIDTSNSGAGTSGVVYGPDGRMYSSAASAIAAGVTNYTRTKPVGAIAGADNLGAGGGGTASRGFMSDNTNSGNVNPGGLITNQSKQLFNSNPNIKLPTGVVNPFSV